MSTETLTYGLSMIDRLAETDGGLTIEELAEAIGIRAGTAQPIVAALLDAAHIRQNASQKYELTNKLLTLARRLLTRLDLRKVAQSYLLALRDRTGESAYLVIRDGDQGRCVASVEAHAHIRPALRIDGACDLYCTAAGKVFLAELPEEDLAAYVKNSHLEPFTPRTSTTLEALRAETARIRSAGYAVDDEEYLVGVRCIAAAVRDFRHDTVAALVIGGPSVRIRRSRIEVFAGHVRTVADELSSNMGADLIGNG